jgi:hypothetical protein
MQPQKSSRDRATAQVDKELGMNVPPVHIVPAYSTE